MSWSRLTRARLLNIYDWIHLSMLSAIPFLNSLTMSPPIHTLSNARCRSIQATRLTFFPGSIFYFLCQVCGLIFSRTDLPKASQFWCQKVVGFQVPLEALVDNSLHSFPNTAGEAYGAVTGCLFGVFPFINRSPL